VVRSSTVGTSGGIALPQGAVEQGQFPQLMPAKFVSKFEEKKFKKV
jgi:hypothetical protein